MSGPNYILSDQASLFGKPDVVGFGSDDFCVREIDRDKANAIIVANHYSGKFYNNSICHLGVFIGGNMVGVLQFGQAMNPASGGGIVTGASVDDFFELNRMWLSDEAPRNSESRALSHALKFIRRRYPKIEWIQSFADERCGGLGVVYQAAGFGFYGEHVATFWELDGAFYHNSMMTRHPSQSRAAGPLQERRNEAVEHSFRQFRYLYWLAPRFERKCRLKRLPFPKPHAARLLDANGTTVCEPGANPGGRSTHHAAA